MVTAVRTLSSADPVMTPAATAAFSLRAPLQTGDTFVAGGTSFVLVKRDTAIPIHMETAAAGGKEAHLTAPPAETTTTSSYCNIFLNPSCPHQTERCMLSCVENGNWGCLYWTPFCAPDVPTTTYQPPVPTRPPKKTEELTTETATSVIIVRPTTTHTETTTSTDTSFKTATTTVMKSNPAYIAAMRSKDASSTLQR